MWEDEHNKLGGRWLINLDKRKRGVELDRFWLETVSIVPASFSVGLTVGTIGRYSVNEQPHRNLSVDHVPVLHWKSRHCQYF